MTDLATLGLDQYLERPYADLKEDWGGTDDCQVCEWFEEVNEEEGTVYHQLMKVDNSCEVHGDPDEYARELEEDRQIAQWEYMREGW
jgi:hypothetical protein